MCLVYLSLFRHSTTKCLRIFVHELNLGGIGIDHGEVRNVDSLARLTLDGKDGRTADVFKAYKVVASVCIITVIGRKKIPALTIGCRNRELCPCFVKFTVSDSHDYRTVNRHGGKNAQISMLWIMPLGLDVDRR